MKHHRISLGFELGSAAVEERLTEIALLMCETFPDCYWEHHDADDHDQHEMHVIVNGREAPLCFTNRELINYSNRRHCTAIDHRMRAVLTQLLDA